MKAGVVHAREDIRYEEIAKPEAGPGRVLIKVKYNKGNRREIMELCEIMKADIVDMSKHFMMIQVCDTPERVKLVINQLQTVSIVEVARTGTLALAKCMENDEG